MISCAYFCSASLSFLLLLSAFCLFALLAATLLGVCLLYFFVCVWHKVS